MLKIKSVLMIVLFLFIASTSITTAGEHPADHPAGEQSAVTTETIAKAIDAHVKNESNQKGGYFIVEDRVAKKTLSLKLDKIHRERLSAIDKGHYFACVDFTNEDGKKYDIDFFLKDKKGKLKVTETMVHKEEGKERYNWVKKGDFWVKKPVE
ncbi:MAG: hypothetical protein IME96_04555 [Proteobacteria bacterium]|nr:hypothetical protein [Pseudomonadota bacterium]